MDKIKKEMVCRSKRFAKWFEVDVVIRLFGHVIFEYHFPPSEATEAPTEKDLID